MHNASASSASHSPGAARPDGIYGLTIGHTATNEDKDPYNMALRRYISCAGIYTSSNVQGISNLFMAEQVNLAFEILSRKIGSPITDDMIKLIVLEANLGQSGRYPNKDWLADNLLQIHTTYPSARILLYSGTENFIAHFAGIIKKLSKKLIHANDRVDADKVLKYIEYKPKDDVLGKINEIARTITGTTTTPRRSGGASPSVHSLKSITGGGGVAAPKAGGPAAILSMPLISERTGHALSHERLNSLGVVSAEEGTGQAVTTSAMATIPFVYAAASAKAPLTYSVTTGGGVAAPKAGGPAAILSIPSISERTGHALSPQRLNLLGDVSAEEGTGQAVTTYATATTPFVYTAAYANEPLACSVTPETRGNDDQTEQTDQAALGQ
jgi:hypothetical protein